MQAVTALAYHTGIPVDTWLDGDERAMWTALDIMSRQAAAMKKGNR